jgi:hypothetical protein
MTERNVRVIGNLYFVTGRKKDRRSFWKSERDAFLRHHIANDMKTINTQRILRFSGSHRPTLTLAIAIGPKTGNLYFVEGRNNDRGWF